MTRFQIILFIGGLLSCYVLYNGNPFITLENFADSKTVRSVGETTANIWVVDSSTFIFRFTPMDWIVICTREQVWLYADTLVNECIDSSSYSPARELRSGKNGCIPNVDFFLSGLETQIPTYVRIPNSCQTIYDMINFVIKWNKSKS